VNWVFWLWGGQTKGGNEESPRSSQSTRFMGDKRGGVLLGGLASTTMKRSSSKKNILKQSLVGLYTDGKLGGGRKKS